MRNEPPRPHFATRCLLGLLALVSIAAVAPPTGAAAQVLSDAEAQAKTVEDMEMVGTAMFNWLVDQVTDPAAHPAADTPATIDMNDYPLIKRKRLSHLLVPQYIAALPEEDGWGNPYELYLNAENPLAPQVMGIRSAGRDGIFSGSLYQVGIFDPESFDEDIVWVDGFFARRPRIPLGDAEAQAKTMSDMLDVGTAMFAWLTDQVGDPAAVTPATIDMNDYVLVKRKKLSTLLVPQYIQALPEEDGWGNPYELYLNTENPLAPQVMGVRSAGRDGIFSGSLYQVGTFAPESFDEDIVWVDGFFARRPEEP